MFMVHVFYYEKARVTFKGYKSNFHESKCNKTKKSSLSFIVISFKQKVQVGYCTGSSRVMMYTLEPCPDFIEDMIKKARRTQ